jgi:hypothetical protein
MFEQAWLEADAGRSTTNQDPPGRLGGFLSGSTMTR